VPLGDEFHVPPLFVVVRMIPPLPTATQKFPTQLTPFRPLVVPPVCVFHVLPPLWWREWSAVPTTSHFVELTQEIERSVLVVPLFSAASERW